MPKPGRPDKSKGKKKFKNLIEKKAKGVRLNQVERKKVVRLEEKIAQKKQINDAVKAELSKLNTGREEEDTRESLCSESSFGSQSAKKAKKRVSFAGNLELTKVFDKNVKDLVIKPSEAEPGKGILRTKAAKGKKIVKTEEKKGAQDKTKTVKRRVGEAAPKEEASEDKENTPTADEEEPPKKKKKIQITKKDKEALLALPRKERKAFLRQLKEKANPLAKKALDAKRLWEIARSNKTPQAEKDEAVSKLVGLVKGKAAQFIYAHDTCRVIEFLVSQNREGITNLLFNELSGEIVRMTKSKYARFFVTKMLKHGSKHQRNIIINAFNGHIVSLMRIVYAAEVVDLAYNDYADKYQRYNYVSEFYGPEFVLFRSSTPKTLEEIITDEPAKKKTILKNMEEQLQVIVEKTTVKLSLTHKIILDFLSYCDKEQFTNMVDSLKDKIPELVHTPEGSYAAMKLIWNSPAKDRKLIVKNFKDLSVKAALEHYGHRVLNAIFDSVDDTVLVNKHIISELSNAIAQLLADNWGETVLYYLVHPRDGRNMDKNEIKKLEEGDSNPNSKKSKSDRYAELFKGIQENLYSYVAANMESLIYEQEKVHFIAACLETTTDYDHFDRVIPAELRNACYSAIAEICKKEFIPMDPEGLHMIEHAGGGFVLNAALRCDPKLPDEQKLSVKLVQELKPQMYGSWIACNKGCHVLAKMIQNGPPIVKEKIKAAVNLKQLKEYTFKGAFLLVDNLK